MSDLDDLFSKKSAKAWRKQFEAKHDEGFQGWRPATHGETWDAMSSKERRSAWFWDMVIAFGGAILIWKFL